MNNFFRVLLLCLGVSIHLGCKSVPDPKPEEAKIDESPGSSVGRGRILSHTFSNAQGVNIISMIDTGSEITVTAIKGGEKISQAGPSRSSFEKLWKAFETAQIAQFDVPSGSRDVDPGKNYVIGKGKFPVNPDDIYVIPRSAAPAAVGEWIEAFLNAAQG